MSFLDSIINPQSVGTTVISGVGQAAVDQVGSLLGAGAVTPGKLPSDFVDPSLNLREEYLVTIQRMGDMSDPKDPMRGISVVANLPDDISFSFSSEWSAPFADNMLTQGINILGTITGHKWVTQGMSTLFWTGSGPVQFSMPLVFVAETGPQDFLKPLMDLYELSLPSRNSAGFFKAPGPKMMLTEELGKTINSVGSSLSLSSLSSIGSGLGATLTSIENKVVNFFSSSPSSGAIAASPDPKLNVVGNAVNEAPSLMQRLFKFEGEISLKIGKFMSIPSVVITNVDNQFRVLMTRDGIPAAIAVTVSMQTHNTPTIEDVKAWFQPDAGVSQGVMNNFMPSTGFPSLGPVSGPNIPGLTSVAIPGSSPLIPAF